MSKSTTRQTQPSQLSTTDLQPSAPIPWKPGKGQQKALKFLLENSVGALFIEPGLIGKTSTMLAALKLLKKRKIFRKALVVAPKRVCYLVWPKEQKKWIDFQGLKVTVLHGKHKDYNLEQPADIYCVNPDSLEWLFSKNFKKLGFDILIIDESTLFKNRRTQRFNHLEPKLRSFARRYILTGGPAPNSLMDLFSQIFILDGGLALGQYITHFRRKYFHPTGHMGYSWELKDGAEDEIYRAIAHLVWRPTEGDYEDLPEIIENPVYVELEGAARKTYQEMEKEFLTQVEENYVTASTAAVASGKCRQIANGGLYDEKHVALHIHDEKTEACLDLVNELNGNPVLIAYEFDHDRKRLLKAFGKDTPCIGGGTSDKRAIEIERDWNLGKIPVLLGHPASMGHGLNLQNAGNQVIWYSLTWNYEHYMQFNRRVQRRGQRHNNVVVHQIIAKDTIDEAVLATLARKGATQDKLLEALRFYAQKKSLKIAKSPLYKSKKMTYVENEGASPSRPGGSQGTKEESQMAEPKKAAAKKSTSLPKIKPVTVDTKKGKVIDGVAKKAAAPVAKAAAPKSEKGPDTRKITVVAKENPKREGSAAYKSFELYSKVGTVEEFLKKGGTKADLRFDEQKGYIKVA